MTSKWRIRLGLRVLSSIVMASATMAPPAAVFGATVQDRSANSLAAATCPSGADLILPESNSATADGWLRLNYDIAGVKLYQDLPPEGLDLANAPDATFTAHGMQTRVDAGPDVSRWRAEMTNFGKARTKGMCRAKGVSASAGYWPNNLNWGGDGVYNTASYIFPGVRGRFYQPVPNPGSCPDNQTILSWVGLGGKNNPLYQAGSSWFGIGTGSFGYHAWWEVIVGKSDTYMVFIPSINVSGGDIIDAQVLVQGSSTSMRVEDVTKGVVSYTSASGGLGSEVDAEWIDERAMIGGQYTSLTKYGTTSWFAMQVMRSNSSSWSGAYSEPNEWWYRMAGRNGTILSLPSGSHSNNTMHDTWKACGITEY